MRVPFVFLKLIGVLKEKSSFVIPSFKTSHGILDLKLLLKDCCICPGVAALGGGRVQSMGVHPISSVCLREVTCYICVVTCLS